MFPPDEYFVGTILNDTALSIPKSLHCHSLQVEQRMLRAGRILRAIPALPLLDSGGSIKVYFRACRKDVRGRSNEKLGSGYIH